MADNSSLGTARKAKNDEFYTQYCDIEAEMNAYVAYDPDVFRDKTILCPCDDPERSNFVRYFAANFARFGLERLMSTSYANGSMGREEHGRVRVMARDAHVTSDAPVTERDGRLEGNGDFHSTEVTALRDEADVIITNPPFSMFREFLAWALETGKDFAILGNTNAITYKEVFPLLRDDMIWLGHNRGGSRKSNSMFFIVPHAYDSRYVTTDEHGTRLMPISAKWFTNIDHGKRHERLTLDTIAHNLQFNKRLRNKLWKDYGKIEYPHYDNYDAIEVPFTECIPSDYDGAMGVPITFMDRYNPEQFEIIGSFNANNEADASFGYVDSRHVLAISQGKEISWNGPVINGKPLYKRIVIQRRGEL